MGDQKIEITEKETDYIYKRHLKEGGGNFNSKGIEYNDLVNMLFSGDEGSLRIEDWIDLMKDKD